MIANIGYRLGVICGVAIAPAAALWIGFQATLSHANGATLLFEMGTPFNREPPQILVHDHEFEAKPTIGSPYIAIRHMGKNTEARLLDATARSLSGVELPLGLHFGGSADCDPKRTSFIQVSDQELGFFVSTESLADCRNFKRVLGGGQNIVLGYQFPRDAPTNIWRQADNELLLEVSANIATLNLLQGNRQAAAPPIAQLSLIASFSSTSHPNTQAIRYVIPFFDTRGISSNRVMSDYRGRFFISSTIAGDRYTDGESNQPLISSQTAGEYQSFRATISANNIAAAIHDLNKSIDHYNRSNNSALFKITTDTTELRLESVGILAEVLFDFDADIPEQGANIEGRGHIELGGAIKEFRVTEISSDGDPTVQFVPVYGHYSPVFNDHFYSRTEGEPVRLGYLREGLAFSVYPYPMPSSRKLFQCVLNKRHFLSTDKYCDGAELQSTLGWVRLGQDYSGEWRALLDCKKGMHRAVATAPDGCERGFQTNAFLDTFVLKGP